MASLWHLLFLILSSLLLVAGYNLPFLFQGGISVDGHNLRVRSDSPLGAPGRWEWKTGGGGDVHHEFPQLSRRKRMVTNHTTTISTPTLNNTGPSFVGTRTSADATTTTTLTTTEVLVEDDTTEGVTGTSPVRTDMLVEANTTKGVTSTTLMTTDGILEADTTEGVTSMRKILPRNSSIGGTGRTTVAFEGKMEVTTRKGPLVETATPRTSVGTSTDSTATPRQSTVPAEPNFRAKGTVRGMLVTAKVASSALTTTKAKPPQTSPSIPNLVSKCLLAIFLLALVAGIFIIITAVLATLLWRQKRAYKLSRHNHTEMVCISSLLADEMEEAGGPHPRVRKMRMLGENASEAEMDNLTLNSFLPDH